MDKEMLDIVNDLSKKPTTELALQIMQLSSENLILEKQVKEQQEVINRVRNNLEKDISMIKTVTMCKEEIITRLEVTDKILKEGQND